MPELRVLTGQSAGLVIPVTGAEFLIGRQENASLRFDPDDELAVSARHAVIERIDDIWWLRDLGSTNGTFVNGRFLHAPIQLKSGDQITFGQGGPVTQWRLRASRFDSTTRRIRAQVARQMHRVRLIALALAVIALALFALFWFLRSRQQSDWQRERSMLMNQIDSLLAAGQNAVGSLQGEVRGLTDALQASESEVRQLSQELETARASLSQNESDQVRRQLQASREALRRLQLAASLDFRTIENRNRSAIALIHAESETGVVSTATAFGVQRNGLLVTSRHVVSDVTGRDRPRRLALQFADSDQLWNAVLVAVSNDADLALVRVVGVVGAIPVVHGLNTRSDTVAPGTPVAVIGFPLGGTGTLEKRRSPVQPLLSAALVKTARQRTGTLEIEGYGTAGASGSPIIDRNGEVVAVLFGGYRDPGTGNNNILGVPATEVLRLLERAR